MYYETCTNAASVLKFIKIHLTFDKLPYLCLFTIPRICSPQNIFFPKLEVGGLLVAYPDGAYLCLELILRGGEMEVNLSPTPE